MERTEYHHYVPRFILRNYRINKLPNKNQNWKQRRKAAQNPQQDLQDKDLKDGLVRQIDIKHQQLVEIRLSKTFGMNNMYTSASDRETDSGNDIEKRLSKLEGQAGELISRIRNDMDSGKSFTTLKRTEKDILRRFFFIMHYRNKTFHGRFTKSKEDYDCNDRALMMEFMDREHLHEPIEVWFRNIRAILEADINDYPNFFESASKLADKYHAYEQDMRWYLKNMQMHYLVFVRPEHPGQEFILTENAFSVFEGPVSGESWTDFHLLSPVSPKLCILSRSNLLGTGYDEDTEQLNAMRRMTTIFHSDPEGAYESVLGDLPVRQAYNSYSRIVNGRREALQTGIRSREDEFYFPFFKISDRHVNLINTILFENAFKTSAIIYHEVNEYSNPRSGYTDASCNGTPVALRAALEFYLKLDMKGFKRTISELQSLPKNFTVFQEKPKATDFLSFDYLKMLETMAKRLGSRVKLQHVRPLFPSHIMLPCLNKDMEPRYKNLGGGDKLSLHDWLQSKRLTRLWIKIDSFIQHESSAHKIRHTRRRFIAAEIPHHRIWLLVKNLKELAREDPAEWYDFNGKGLEIPGVEDTLADVHHIFETFGLGRLMQAASQIEDIRARNPDFGLGSGGFTLDERGARRLKEEVGAAFACRNIENCGIPAIRSAVHSACPLLAQLSLRQQRDTISQKILTGKQHFELITRRAVAESFPEIDLQLPSTQREKLYKALFEVCFPLEIVVDKEVR